MLYFNNPLEDVKEMKALTRSLIDFTPPKFPKDDDISCLKNRDIVVDGIPILAHYTISDYGSLMIHILTLGCKDAPFMPTYVVCKAAKMFLGEKHLTLFEYVKGNCKIYSWMIVAKKGKVVEYSEPKAKKVSYRGLDFQVCEGENPP